jgi:hypothetical protein
MRFHHAVLLAVLAIAPVCAERIKVSDEQGIVDSTLSAVGELDCGGGGLHSSGGGGGGGLGCDQIIRRRMVGGVAVAAGGRAEKNVAVVVGGRGAAAADELRCNNVGQRVRSRGISGSGIAARQTRRLVANGQSEDDDPRGGDRRAMGAVNALNCGEGGGIAGTTAIACCLTAGGVATTAEGPGDDDGEVEALAVRVTDC